MLEVITEWAGPQGSGLRSIMYFDGGTVGELSAARGDLNAFWGGMSGVLSDQYTWNISPAARVLAPNNGGLIDVVSDVSVLSGAGAQAQQPVPDASQVLTQWRTGIVLGGRFLQGRTYVPGLTTGSITAGNITPVVVAALNGVVSDFLAASGGQFGIWHRPTGGSGGSWSPVVSGAVWGELAVQRRRRG